MSTAAQTSTATITTLQDALTALADSDATITDLLFELHALRMDLDAAKDRVATLETALAEHDGKNVLTER